MLTKTEILAAPATMDDVDRAMVITLVQDDEYYRENKVIYPDLAGRLAAIDGTAQARMVNATLDKIEALGVGEIKLHTPEDGLDYDQSAERTALIRYMLSILYDAVINVYSTTSQLNGFVQVGQRGVNGGSTSACPNCSWPCYINYYPYTCGRCYYVIRWSS